MPVYKDKGKGNYYVSFHYEDWTGKNVRKLKRGFATKKEEVDLQVLHILHILSSSLQELPLVEVVLN